MGVVCVFVDLRLGLVGLVFSCGYCWLWYVCVLFMCLWLRLFRGGVYCAFVEFWAWVPGVMFGLWLVVVWFGLRLILVGCVIVGCKIGG